MRSKQAPIQYTTPYHGCSYEADLPVSNRLSTFALILQGCWCHAQAALVSTLKHLTAVAALVDGGQELRQVAKFFHGMLNELVRHLLHRKVPVPHWCNALLVQLTHKLR